MSTAKSVWNLKRYGRFVPKASDSSWKVFESSESKGRLELTVLQSGHLLVTQAQELLEGFSLLSAQSLLKIQQKSDSLLVYITLKEVSRLMRLQFEGSSRLEATELCRKAVDRLQEYLPAGTPEQAGPSSGMPDTAGIFNQQKQIPVAAPQANHVMQESLSITQLSQHFLNENGLALPLAYRHFTLPPVDMEALLRLCLLDSGFPAFVEEVENKLKKLIQQ